LAIKTQAILDPARVLLTIGGDLDLEPACTLKF